MLRFERLERREMLAAAEPIQTDDPVVPDPPNSPPVAVDDQYVTRKNKRLRIEAVDGILANDYDPDGDQLVYLTIGGDLPINGTLTPSPDGGFEYYPDKHFVGTDTFTYSIDDADQSNGRSNVATVSITTFDKGRFPPALTDYYIADAIADVQERTRLKNANRLTGYVDFYAMA